MNACVGRIRDRTGHVDRSTKRFQRGTRRSFISDVVGFEWRRRGTMVESPVPIGFLSLSLYYIASTCTQMQVSRFYYIGKVRRCRGQGQRERRKGCGWCDGQAQAVAAFGGGGSWQRAGMCLVREKARGHGLSNGKKRGRAGSGLHMTSISKIACIRFILCSIVFFFFSKFYPRRA